MIEYLIDTYFSKTTCRLLRSKLEKGLKEDQKTINYFSTILFTDDVREKIYCLINNMTEKQSCKNRDCNNTTKFLDVSRGYRDFCCISCSKNPEQLKTINLFNGVHLIRKEPHNEKTLYFKKVREITRLTYNQNKVLLNPDNLPLRRSGTPGGYQLDHIISVNYGFENNINPEIIGGLDNLQVIPWRVNSVKNKYIDKELDIDDIINNYNKKEYNLDLTIDDFILNYCLDKSGRVNTKINKEWFINRNCLTKYNDIMRLTDYLKISEKVPFRIFCIYYGLHKSKSTYQGSRANWMRRFLNPTIDYKYLTGDDKIDFQNNFMCYDKRIGKYRLKSNSYDWKETANRQGTLFLYYKYF